jgi:hypothetical protein
MLFEEVQNFFVAVPPSATKDSNSQEAMALRTVKTLVNEVVRIKGTSVREHLTRVPPSAEKENSPILVQYIELMLENQSTGTSSKITCPAELEAILVKIEEAQGSSDMTASEAGVKELQQYRAANPRVDIEAHMQTSIKAQTQGFIRAVLDNSTADSATPQSSRTPLQSTQQQGAGTNDNAAKTYMSRLHTLQSRYGFKSSPPATKVVEKEDETEESTEDLTNKYKDRLKYLQDRYGFSKGGPAETKTATQPSTSMDVKELKERMKDLSASHASPQPEAKPDEVKEAPAVQDATSGGSSVADLRARLNRVKGIAS